MTWASDLDSSRSRVSRWLTLAILSITTLVFLVLPVWALQWSKLPFPGFFVQQNLVIIDIKGSDWPSESVQQDAAFSRILAVDGRPVQTNAQFLERVATHDIGDTLSLTLESKTGAERNEIAVPLAPFAKLDLVHKFWLPYLLGWAFLVLGGWVLRLRQEQVASQIFAIVCALIALSIGLVFDTWTSQHLVRLWTSAVPLSASATILLALIFPQQIRLFRRRPVLVWLAFIPGLAGAIAGQLGLVGSQDPWAYIEVWRLNYILSAIAMLFFLAMMAYRQLQARSPIVRGQSTIILWASLLAFAPLGIWMIRTILVQIPTSFDPLLFLPIILFPSSITYAILRYRLLDIDRLIQDGVVYLLLTGLVVLATILVVDLASLALGTLVELDSPITIAVIATVLVLFFNPLRAWLQALVDRIFHRQDQDFGRHLQEFSHTLTRTLDLEDIVAAIHSHITNALRPANLAIFILDHRAAAFLPIQNEYSVPILIPQDSPLIGHLARQRALLFPEGDDRLPAELAPAEDLLNALNARVVAPIHGSESLTGILVMGPHRSGQSYSHESIAFLETLVDQASLALERAQILQAAATQAQQLAVLNQASQTLTSTLDAASLLQIIMEKAVQVLKAEAGSFLLRDNATDELVFEVCSGPAAPMLEGKRIPLTAGLAGAAIREELPVIANDAHSDLRWFNKMDQQTTFETRSILAVPLISKTDTIGVLELINKRNHLPFNKEDQELARAFAAQAAIALENARLYTQTDQSLAQRVHELTMMQELDRVLNANLDIARVLSMTLDWVMRMTQARSGVIGLIDDQTGELVLATRNGDTLAQPTRWPLDAGIKGRAVRLGRPCLVADVNQDPDYVCVNTSTQSQLCVPITRDDNVIGVISLESESVGGFGEMELGIAARLADHAAVAIDNAHLYDQVKRANEAKSEFISLVSHELKTPMTSIQGYADLLRSRVPGELSEMQDSFLQTIADNVKRMQSLVKDLADSSRIETGQLSFEKQPTLFYPIVEESLRTMRSLCKEEGLELILECPPDLPQVEGNHVRLVQILTNMVSNAIKYTPSPGRVTVKVALAPTELPGTDLTDCIICSVQDTGIGISPQDQLKMFSKFFRSDQQHVQQTTGTGLGLFITKSLIEMHAGKIWLESTPGEGSTFTFAIPYLKEAA